MVLPFYLNASSTSPGVGRRRNFVGGGGGGGGFGTKVLITSRSR